MTNALLNFVAVVNQTRERKGDHHIFAVSVTVYAGKDASSFKYDTFAAVCVLPPGKQWRCIEPRPDRSVQVQRDLADFYFLRTRLSPCLLLHTLSYSASPTSGIARPSASTPTTPRARLKFLRNDTSTETSSLEADGPDPPPPFLNCMFWR
ncbi:hypothetical protein V8E54_002065 [Elaphomyces granulatus]